MQPNSLFRFLSTALSTAALTTEARPDAPLFHHHQGGALRHNTAVRQEPYSGYAFLYFTSDDEQLYLAASDGNDALAFTELNGGNPVLTSSKGDAGVRDPFIMRSIEGDRFFVIATDLCIACGTSWDEAVRHGSLHLEIWETEDLITFSEQRHVLVSPDSYGNTWAPEAYYDRDLGTYMVFWASAIYDGENDPDHQDDQYQRMVYATTDDFVTFSEPEVWQDAPPEGRIDSTVTEVDGTYYRFTKATIGGCADIVQEASPSLTASLDEWAMAASCIGQNAGTEAVEGPAIFKTNSNDVNGERYVLLVDEYSGGGYVPLESSDIASGQWTLNSGAKFPESPRHGTVIPLTADELNTITDHYGA